MLVAFFFELRSAGIPVSVTEFLTLLEALDKRAAGTDVDGFYYLARAVLVKDERHFDRFDQIFGHYFKGIEALFEEVLGEVPLEWLARRSELELSAEERLRIEALGGWEKLMETLRKRLEEQKKRHQGGGKWIGTAGTSPFGAHGYNPQGVRIGQPDSRHRRALKVWERREHRNLDGNVEVGTRNIKLALRRLREFAREGAADELALDDTIRATALNAGLLDLQFRAQRRNNVKVLLFLDVGGSMDDHVRVCEELFSAARAEFARLQYFYFHNFVYEGLWKDGRRRHTERMPTWDVIHTFARDHRLIVVGDATMSPYEIVYPGASIEHWNEESGRQWMQRLLDAYPRAIWLNPEPRARWSHTPSIKIVRELMGGRMFELTLDGLDQGMRALARKV